MLIKIIQNNPNCHFIIDETMLIFDKNFFNKNLIKYVNTVDNLSVIVSFSKFFGIAGLRTGAVFSNNELIEKIKKQFHIVWELFNKNCYHVFFQIKII